MPTSASALLYNVKGISLQRDNGMFHLSTKRQARRTIKTMGEADIRMDDNDNHFLHVLLLTQDL